MLQRAMSQRLAASNNHGQHTTTPVCQQPAQMSQGLMYFGADHVRRTGQPLFRQPGRVRPVHRTLSFEDLLRDCVDHARKDRLC